MTDPGHLANTLVEKAFGPHLGDRLPKNLGREAYYSVRKRLSCDGYGHDLHAEEPFSRSLTKGFVFLNEHGGETVRDPRLWFLTICRNETVRYLVELSPMIPLAELVDGSRPYTNPIRHDDAALQEIREAVNQLPPRYRELIRLDLYECLTAREIQAKMGIRSNGYFRKLKCEAFGALRDALKALIQNGIDSLF